MKALIYFCTLYKNYHKTQTCNSFALIFGTNEQHVEMNSCAKFAVNLLISKEL